MMIDGGLDNDSMVIEWALDDDSMMIEWALDDHSIGDDRWESDQRSQNSVTFALFLNSDFSFRART